jgi:hypothetical protein
VSKAGLGVSISRTTKRAIDLALRRRRQEGDHAVDQGEQQLSRNVAIDGRRP